MGRKRKATTAILNKDETSNARPLTATTHDQDIINLSTENPNAMEATNVEIKLQPCSNPSKNSSVMAIRRSSRRTNSVLQTKNQQDSKPVVNQVINLVENENEEQVTALPIISEHDLDKDIPQAPPQVSHVPVGSNRNLGQKVDYIVQAVDEFKSKMDELVSERTNEGPSNDLSYKSLYITSQKKVDALMEDKFELVKELEYARGQIAVYEKMKDAMCAAKEVILVSGLGRATEDIVHLSTKRAQNRTPPNAENDHETSLKQKKNNYSKKKAKP